MTDLYPAPAGFEPPLDPRLYEQSRRAALENPDAFWGEIGRRLTWSKPYRTVMDVSFRRSDFRIRRYADGEF